MSEGGSFRSCRNLEQAIRVFVGSGEVGEVQALPLSPHPTSVQDLKVLKEAYYLDSFEEKACAYPIRFFQNEVNPFSPPQVFDPRYLRLPAYYGIPSAIQLVGAKRPVQGVVFEPSRGIFFGTVLAGMHTYLIGNAENHQRQAHAVKEFAEYLFDTWKENPLGVLRAVPWDLNDPRKYPRFSSFRANEEISKFLDWLHKEDFDLWDRTLHHVGFPLPPRERNFLETLFLRPDPLDSAYAVYDSHRRRIFFNHWMIEKLSQGNYAAARQVLAHEAAHMKSHEKGGVMPSEVMLHLSLEKFLEKILPDGIGGIFLEPFAKEYLIPVVAQSLLPILPEEELQAYSEELRYAREKGLSGTQALQKEAREIHDYIHSQLQEYFPEDWRILSLQYYLLATEVQKEEKNTPTILAITER